MNALAIQVQGLRKRYAEKQVLDHVHIEVPRGSIFALLGENGAGKTTTVRILSTLIQADGGKATIDGYDVSRDAAQIRNIISLTGQYAAVDELLTGEENLLLMGSLLHLDRRIVKQRTVELLEQFDLSSAARRSVKTYSGGMRRKLDIAVSLLASPSVIFLDEPTTGLDPRSRATMWELIRNLAKDGVTIFLTTQYLEEADQLADKIAVLSEGRIVAEGTSEELKAIVGQEMLELRFQTAEDCTKAGLLLQVQHDSETLLRLPAGENTDRLRMTLNTLHEHSITPAAVEYRKPTLDDVFMTMTGEVGKGVRHYA
ncbi:ATP-binding cassette domain-containing protein [Paenibacillus sp. 1P07SE]|uniref:ATP-binding cassette domain-containing protein n=1 Tax=Paenibacillus sp. 1P07SE TaxID=3132209 RepID=UPI0039A513F9